MYVKNKSIRCGKIDTLSFCFRYCFERILILFSYLVVWKIILNKPDEERLIYLGM